MAKCSLKILIVEDHFDTAQILAAGLKRLGHTTVVACDCASALKAVQRSGFDLVFCDIGLPDGNGADLFAELNQIRTTRGIALTGFCMPDELRRFEQAGFLTTLEKPFHLGDIGKAVDHLIENTQPYAHFMTENAFNIQPSM